MLDETVLESIVCRQQESETRLDNCKNCINFYTDQINEQTRCKISEENISLLVTMAFKQCPIGKW